MLSMPRRALSRCVLLAVVLAPMTMAVAEESWLAVGPEGAVAAAEASPRAPAVTVPRSDDEGLTATIAVAGLSLRSRTTKGGEFVDVNWPDAAVAGRIGTPATPVVRELFLAPLGATVTVTARLGEATRIDLASVGCEMPVMPVQAPIEKLPGAIERAPFHQDQATYAMDADLPLERVTLEELGIVRGQRLFLLEVAPVAYNPAAGRLTLWPGIEVELRFTGGSGWPRDLSPLPGLDRIVLNPEPLSSGSRGSGNYLIIVDDTYESGIASFAAAKAAQGFDVTSWVPTTSSTTAIKAYIEDLWGTGEAPDYILLVGDTDTIPHWTGGGDGSPSTDLPYSCMDGGDDWYPDIALGRFPVRSAEHLTAIVDKTLYYESGALADPDYLKRAVFMASEDNWTVSEGTHNWVIDNYMDPNEYISDKLYCHTYSATTQQVRDAFNDGRFFGVYSGHGGTYSWADGPPFSQSDVNGLTNENMYAFVCSFACVTGTFTADECFVETWIRAANKGALAIYGSSVNSYWTEDDVLEKRLFDAIFDEEDDVPAEVGPVWNDARMRYLAQMGSGSTTRRYFEMYNLMGDPSLAFFDAGEPLTISLPEGVPEYLDPGVETTITVQIDDGRETVLPESCTLHWRYETGAFLTATLVPLGGNLYEATLPPADCDAAPGFYFTATGDGGTTVYNPPSAPNGAYTAVVATVTTIFNDNFESDTGWTVEDVDLLDGSWERGLPAGGGLRGDPPNDFDGSGQCYLTANREGDSDVDGGPTRLISSIFDMSGLNNPVLEYARWWTNDDDDGDRLDVEVSNDGGSSWVVVESVPHTPGGWVERSINLTGYVSLTPLMRVRFSAADTPNDSVDEGGIDSFRIIDLECGGGIDCDFNSDGSVDLADFAALQVCYTGAGLGPVPEECTEMNLDSDEDVDLDDFSLFLPLMLGPQ